MKVRTMTLACIALLALTSLGIAQQSSHMVFLVRHAEATSTAHDAALTPAGKKRAECLAKTLADADIKQIYTSDFKRTQQTAAPVATRLGVKATIVPTSNSDALGREILQSAEGNVLVVWHSDRLPGLIQSLQAGTVKPIAGNEFDRLFVVNIEQGKASPVTTLRYCEAGAPPNQAAAGQMMTPNADKK